MALKSNEKDNVVTKLVSDMTLPPMIKIRQIMDESHISPEEIPSLIREGFTRGSVRQRIKPGMRVAITCGSRGIANIAAITKSIVETVREMETEPFVFPAMGSHGGATAEGQIRVLSQYGITAEYLGCPIKSSMDTVKIGATPEGMPVFADKHALEADAVILCGRIKAHTAFQGPYESGLLKMAVIGMGNQLGAETAHESGFVHLGRLLPQCAKVTFENANIIAGVGIVENAFHKTCKIEVIDRDDIFDREPELLLEAKKRMGRILLDNLDVLVVDRIGKNISGEGMDPHVTGRFAVPEAVSGGINVKRLAVLDLTDETHGNFNGLGHADCTTKRVFDKADADETYPNGVTFTVIRVCKMPMFTHTDRACVQLALRTCNETDKKNPRIVRIRDTADVTTIWISPALLDEALQHPRIEVIGEPEEWAFDANGNLW